MEFDKKSVIVKFGSSDKDSGNTKVQIAIMSEKISLLTEHLKENKKDFSARLGLKKLVGKRKRLLNYLKSKNLEEYKNLIKELGLRR